MSTFEETLAELERESLPPEWRKDLIDSAMTEASESNIVRPRFGLVSKLAWGVIAACWIAIAAMHLSTPASPGTAELAERFGIEEEQVYLLAARFDPAGNAEPDSL